jgi:TonB family protein
VSSSRSSDRPRGSPRLAWAVAVSIAAHAAAVALVQATPARLSESARAQLNVLLQPQAAVLAEAKPAAQPAPGARPAKPSVTKHYYKTSELDVKPGIMLHVEPRYPERAAQDAVGGRVVAQLFLREDGTVEQVSILRAEPPGYFEYSVEQAFSAARFTPGMKDGRTVKVQMALEVSFGDGER